MRRCIGPLAAATGLVAAMGLAAAGGRAMAQGSDSQSYRIQVDAARVLNRTTPWMYGSCIEDVNHEIYGGLYAQMIFGESFEEPPISPPLEGWSTYGGQWNAENGILTVSPDAGAKLVRDGVQVTDGTVETDVRLNDNRGDNAGLILRVQNPRVGADTWSGYELSISALHHFVILGRHRENWEPLKTAPAAIEPGRWYRLRAELRGPEISVFLDGAPVLQYRDKAPLVSGGIGLRTWNSLASFRNLTVETAAGKTAETFTAEPDAHPMGTLSGMWDPVDTGTARGRLTWDGDEPFNSLHSQRIELLEGSGAVGMANRGLNRWGLTVRAGRRYAGRVYLRERNYPGEVTAALQSADGSRTYAEARLPAMSGQWARYSFSLKSSETDPNARFALWIDQPGAVWVDQVYLAPTGKELFHGLPFRADVGDSLVAQGLRILRYGGSMVNAPEYRWKRMLGDPDRRPQYKGTWYPFSTNGFGIEEFVRFCEAARIEPAFAINIDETPEDAADLVEYLNGTADSPWGRKRAENGHPKPYGVRYIEIGNEEAIDGNHAWYERYLQRFQLLEPAMHARDPKLQLIVAAWWRPDEPVVKRIAQELSGKAALWDVHVGGDDLREGKNVDALFTRMESLFRDWGVSLRACVLEENGGRHDLQRALGHAHILNATQRHGDFVLMDCPANCLQPWRQNDNGWDQGQLFLTSGQVWGMPPYFAQQMAALNHEPLHVAAEVSGAGSDLDVIALRSEDGKTLVIRVVNLGAQPRTAQISVSGFRRDKLSGRLWELKGELNGVNTPEEPERIRWVQRDWKPEPGAGEPAYAFPAHSFTVLRLE